MHNELLRMTEDGRTEQEVALGIPARTQPTSDPSSRRDREDTGYAAWGRLRTAARELAVAELRTAGPRPSKDEEAALDELGKAAEAYVDSIRRLNP